MQNVQQQIKDFHAAREDATAAAGLDQEMADNRHLIATTGEALRGRQAEDREKARPVKWFGRGREEEREAQQEAREQEAQEWLQAHEAEKLARAAAREAQASQARGGGITHTGSEDITISGQAFGHGAEVRNIRQGETGSHGGGRGGHRQGERGGAEHSGHEGPYIVSTGSGSVNVSRSAVGNNIHMINYGDRESVVTEQSQPQSEQGLEAGQ